MVNIANIALARAHPFASTDILRIPQVGHGTSYGSVSALLNSASVNWVCWVYWIKSTRSTGWALAAHTEALVELLPVATASGRAGPPAAGAALSGDVCPWPPWQRTHLQGQGSGFVWDTQVGTGA